MPVSVRRLLFFARPDLVVCINDGVRPVYPIFAFELTDHVPAQDHWMQRFNHLVGCAQEGVPGAYVMPFEMSHHPKFKSQLDHVFFFAYDRVTEIHETPVFIAEWETPDGITPKGDKTYPKCPDRNLRDLKRTFEYLERVIEYAIHGRPLRELIKERLIVDLRNRVRTRGYSQIPEIKDFRRLSYNMPNNRPLTRAEFVTWLNPLGQALPAKLPDRIAKRDAYLIFVPQVGRKGKTTAQLRQYLLEERIKKRNGDPYVGMPLAFDYLFCRLGATPYERDTNLVIDLSILKFADLAEFHKKVWEKSPLQHTDIKILRKDIPSYTMHLREGSSQTLKEILRIYAFAADIIVFEDALIYF